MATQSPYLVQKRIVDEGKTWGFVLKTRGKQVKIPKDDVIKLVETEPRSVLVDMPGADKPVFLTVIEGKPDKNDKIKKSLRTVWDDTIKNNLNKVKTVKLISCNKLKIFKSQKKLITI